MQILKRTSNEQSIGDKTFDSSAQKELKMQKLEPKKKKVV